MNSSLSLELKFKEDFEKLITSLSNLKNAVEENNPEKISNYLNQFTLFLKNYFEKEEKFMEELKYPDFEHHKREHDLFKKKIKYLFKKLEKKETILNKEIVEVLENLLIEHAIHFDKPLNLYFKSRIDSLTEFLSREAFLETLQDFITKEKLTKDITLILFELEDFPLIFFSLGSQITNQLLKDFSTYLRNQFDIPNILFGKNKENQFLIALLGVSFLEVLEFLENLTEKVKAYSFKFENKKISLNISIGVTLYPQDGKDAYSLLKNAEIALQMAKKEGKFKWMFFESKFLKHFEKLNKFKNIFEKVIREHLIIPYIQPIFDVHTGSVVGGEVLIRILDDKGKIICACDFINYAYELKYIDELEALLGEKIIEPNFFGLFKNRFLFINKVVTSYDKVRFLLEELKVWKTITENYNISCIFEITESSILEFLDFFEMLSTENKTEKVGIAIDDFGSGYASFTSLIKINPKFLKIDGNLIRQILKSKKCYTIVKGIVSIAKELNIKTIAEFVENERIAKALREIGVDLFQGFYLSKPVSVEEFKKLIS